MWKEQRNHLVNQYLDGNITLMELREMKNTGLHNWNDKAVVTAIGTIHRINLKR